jgi:hypothetical protein
MTVREEHSHAPRGTTRKIITAMVVLATVAVLALIAFVLLTDFPGEPMGSADKTGAPPEDVRR